MQNFNTIFDLNNFEKLFLEKSSECLYSNTIDSYRLRLHNPKTLIEELITVINDSIHGVLTNNDYVDATAKELKRILGTGNHNFKFHGINEKHFITLLDKPNSTKYKTIQQACKILLKYNLDYQEKLLHEISVILNSYNTFIDRKTGHVVESFKKEYNEIIKKLLYLIDFFYIELINNNFSKQHLYKLIQSLFIYYKKNDSNFDIQFNLFKKLISKEDEKYTIIFTLDDNSLKFTDLSKINSTYFFVDARFRNVNKNLISERGNKYLEKYKSNFQIGLIIKTKDHYKATQLSIDQISRDLDIYHLALNNKTYSINPQCLVIGEIMPSKADTVPINYQIDGYFRSNIDIYNYIVDKINEIKESNIDKDSYQKILSAIRYFRTGTESPELETKFLNYWIGLEFIFNSFSNDEKTITRIRNYFKKIHSLVYIKRNLYDFHKSLKRVELDSIIPDYDDNLKYLLNNLTFQIIVNNSKNQLLIDRALYYQKWFQEPNQIVSAIRKHQENLDWNITRLYRIRNEIVHNAAIKNGIYVHISHLKYYLTFTLNSIMDFMSDPTPDIDNDGKVTIDDFFICQDIILGCNEGEKLEKWIELKHPNQIFQ